MRVKVGNTWYDCQPGQPIMVELTDAEKRDLKNLPTDATRYALFARQDTFNKGTMKDWMDDGATFNNVHPGDVHVLDR